MFEEFEQSQKRRMIRLASNCIVKYGSSITERIAQGEISVTAKETANPINVFVYLGRIEPVRSSSLSEPDPVVRMDFSPKLIAPGKEEPISTSFPATEYFEVFDRGLQEIICGLGVLERHGAEFYNAFVKRIKRYMLFGGEGYSIELSVGRIASPIGPYRGRFLDDNMRRLDDRSVYRGVVG